MSFLRLSGRFFKQCFRTNKLITFDSDEPLSGTDQPLNVETVKNEYDPISQTDFHEDPTSSNHSNPSIEDINFKSTIITHSTTNTSPTTGVSIPSINSTDDIFTYSYETTLSFQQILGAANDYKEGDDTLGLAASDEVSRINARVLLSRTTIEKMHENPVFKDELQQLIWDEIDTSKYNKIKKMTLGELKIFLLDRPEEDIKNIMDGLTSQVIGSVVKLMTNEELGKFSRKMNTPNRPNEAGTIGIFSARTQPNSPDDDLNDIMIQVLDGFSYAVGDLILGTNPVSSTRIHDIEILLKEIVETFEREYEIEDLIPWCVLGHIDDQFEVEKQHPGSTKVWFQSLAGTSSALRTFGLDVQKMLDYAEKRKEMDNGYSFYFETGQGADFSNGHGKGFDMVIHEANKYSFAKILKKRAGDGWMIVNDVAGFIGPEIFRTKDQLLRTVLEDTAMGKLNNITIGLDICSTLHMDVSLEDLQYVQDEVMKLSAPGYLIALPTRNDPMLGYLTTSYHDHLRIRKEHCLTIQPKMEKFFKKLGILDEKGEPTENFGNPRYVYMKYLEAKNDPRFTKFNEDVKNEVYAEADEIIDASREKNVFISENYGENYWEMEQELKDEVEELYLDAKKSVWKEFEVEQLPEFTVGSEPEDGFLYVETKSLSREDFVLHPTSGESLTSESLEVVKSQITPTDSNVIVLISDGLNAYGITDENHIVPFLEELKNQVNESDVFSLYEKYLVVKHGRVRIGYEVGDAVYKECLFGEDQKGAIINLIGERPGTGHHPFSAYLSLGDVEEWETMDHDTAKLVAGISDTGGQSPKEAAVEVMELLEKMFYRE